MTALGILKARLSELQAKLNRQRELGTDIPNLSKELADLDQDVRSYGIQIDQVNSRVAGILGDISNASVRGLASDDPEMIRLGDLLSLEEHELDALKKDLVGLVQDKIRKDYQLQVMQEEQAKNSASIEVCKSSMLEDLLVLGDALSEAEVLDRDLKKGTLVALRTWAAAAQGSTKLKDKQTDLESFASSLRTADIVLKAREEAFEGLKRRERDAREMAQHEFAALPKELLRCPSTEDPDEIQAWLAHLDEIAAQKSVQLSILSDRVRASEEQTEIHALRDVMLDVEHQEALLEDHTGTGEWTLELAKRLWASSLEVIDLRESLREARMDARERFRTRLRRWLPTFFSRSRFATMVLALLAVVMVIYGAMFYRAEMGTMVSGGARNLVSGVASGQAELVSGLSSLEERGRDWVGFLTDQKDNAFKEIEDAYDSWQYSRCAKKLESHGYEKQTYLCQR